MQNNIDYREIVQTVTSNVLTELKAQLASMKSEIVDELAEKVKSSLQPSFDVLSSQLGGMQWRISELEQKSGSSNKRKPTQSPHTSEDVSPQLGVNTEACRLLLWIQNQPHIVHNGWIIFYDGWRHFVDEKKRDSCIYMVRENGTQITDVSSLFKFNDECRFMTVWENGSDWLVKYGEGGVGNYTNIAVIHMS